MNLNPDNSAASNIFRAVNYAANTYNDSNPSESHPIYDLVHESEKYDYYSATPIAIALDDYGDKVQSFHYDQHHTNITADDAEEFWPWEKTDNIFATDKGQEFLEERGKLYQNDIYDEEISIYGGIKYACPDKLGKSALNFAKADTKAIENAYDIIDKDNTSKVNGKLDSYELQSCFGDSSYADEALKFVDLDGNADDYTAEEYASFLLAIDDDQNGIITKEEARAAQDTDNQELRQKAKYFYNLVYVK